MIRLLTRFCEKKKRPSFLIIYNLQFIERDLQIYIHNIKKWDTAYIVEGKGKRY